MNGNIIDQYGTLKDNIDQLIAKKKAEAVLDAYKNEYQAAMKNQSDATKTLTELRQKYNDELNKTTNGYKEEMEKSRNLAFIGEQIKKQSELIGEYGYTIENYENLTSASVSNSKDEINKAISEMGVSYDQAKAKTSSSLTEQIQSQNNYLALLKQSWQDAKNNNDNFQEEILKKQIDTQEQSLTNLAISLGEQTSTVSDLTEDQKTAWKNLAELSGDAYRAGLEKVPETTRQKIYEATGVIAYDNGLSDASKQKANETTIMFAQNLQISDETKENIKKASANLESDQMVKNGAKTLANNANDGFNGNVKGNEWGTDLSKNISNGMTNNESKFSITSAAAKVGEWISEFLHHTTPDKGPLKNDDEWMSDFIDNLANGILDNKSKVVNSVKKMSKEMKNALDVESVQDFGKLQGSLSREIANNTKIINNNNKVTVQICSQQLTEAELNKAVDYLNKKLGQYL